MGLDMYVRDGKGEEVGYWRKFGELHNLLASIYVRETGDKESFNCKDFKLTPEICDEIIDALRGKSELPDHSGFFFGGSNKDDKEWLREQAKIWAGYKIDIEEGTELIYSAWY